MDFSELLGLGIGAGATGAIIQRWMEIDDDETLEDTIRNDIRDFTPETVQILLDALKTMGQSATLVDMTDMRDRVLKVGHALIHEAGRQNLLP